MIGSRTTSLLVTLFLAVFLVDLGKTETVAAPRPNIVFILVDDLRWDALGCTGHPFVKTPNIDRIAAEGMIFRNAFVTTPLCSPSRASYLTGLYAHKHLIQGNGDSQGLSHQLKTFPRLLAQAGYDTGYVGKWHMGDDDAPRPGFRRWVSFKGQGDYTNPQLNVDGAQVKTDGYVTDILTDYAEEFLQQSRDKPFVLYLAHKAIHSSFTPAPRHKDWFADETIVRAPNVKDSLEGKPVLTRKLPQEARSDRNPGTEDRTVFGQLRGLVAIDEGVGRLRKALEKSGQLDNTLFVFTSDNGFFWGEHGLGDKRAAYEESIRIPLIMRFPPLIAAGTKREEMVLNVDMAPTFLDLAGISVPSNIHGRSLIPVLKGTASNWRDSMLTEYFASAHNRIPGWQAVRTAQWKYIHYMGEGLAGLDELYDLSADRYEMKNLIAEPGLTKTVDELRRELDRLNTESN